MKRSVGLVLSVVIMGMALGGCACTQKRAEAPPVIETPPPQRTPAPPPPPPARIPRN